jgi:transposase-like protein
MRTTTMTGLVTATAPAAKLPVTVDTRGRVRTSREQRRLILDKFERSGVSAVEFARRSGLKYSTLAGWRQRHRRAKRPGLVRPVRLLEAVLPAASLPALSALPVLPVLLPGGARLEITCAAQLPLAVALLRELEKPAATC